MSRADVIILIQFALLLFPMTRMYRNNAFTLHYRPNPSKSACFYRKWTEKTLRPSVSSLSPLSVPFTLFGPATFTPV